jgi:hypothetical protein
MSDPTNDDDTEAADGRIAYAPKWVRNRGARDPDHLTSPSIADTEFAQHDDSSLAEQLIDPPRTARSLNSRLNEARQARSAWHQAAESMFPRSRATDFRARLVSSLART